MRPAGGRAERFGPGLDGARVGGRPRSLVAGVGVVLVAGLAVLSASPAQAAFGETSHVRYYGYDLADRLAAAGAGVLALCYGFARYPSRPFLPRFSQTFGLPPVSVRLLGRAPLARSGPRLLPAPGLRLRRRLATSRGGGGRGFPGGRAVWTERGGISPPMDWW